MPQRRIVRSTLGLIVIATVVASSAARAGARDEICKDPLLNHQEQSLCTEQMAAAQSVAEQKQIQAKFRDRIAKRKSK